MKKIKVDLDKWENLVRLAKAAGDLFDANNEPEGDKRARLEVSKEYELFCGWRHTEPYKSGNFEDEPLIKEAPRSVYLIALQESLKLQAHYGRSLNDLDGGKRMIFKSVSEWFNRLDDTGAFNNLSDVRERDEI